MTAPNVATTSVAPAAEPLPTSVTDMVQRISQRGGEYGGPSADAPPVAPVPAPTGADPAPDLGGEPSTNEAAGLSAALPGERVPSDAPATLSPDGGAASDQGDTPSPLVIAITADEPEGEVVLRARDPNTGQWSEMDQSRTYELSIRDKETGETRVYNKTLPDLMRMAKDGVAMQKSKDELTYYRQQVPEWQTQFTAVRSEAESLRALAIELLTAPDEIVVARREAYAAEQTPEKQIARREAELAARERQILAHQAAAQQQQALAQRIGPIVQEIESLVGREAAAGKLSLEMAPLMVNGRIPPERFPQLEAFVHGPYRAWAQAEAAKRGTAQSEVQRQLEAVNRTRQAAQQAANAAAAATRPVGSVTGGMPAPRKAPGNARETVDAIIAGHGSHSRRANGAAA